MDGQEYKNKTEEMEQKAKEMQEKVRNGINNAMTSAAEKLDQAAENMHKTAIFFRDKNADTIKDDISGLVKKHPGKTLAVAVVLGFFAGKIISR